MEIKEIKKEMLAYTDFYGFDMMYEDEIKKAKTKKDLNGIINQYSVHIEMMESDAQSHLENLKRRLGLSDYF